eukprot:CFRG5281T1
MSATASKVVLSAVQKQKMLAEISARLFGQLPNTNKRNGLKQIKRPLKGASTVAYYPDHVDTFHEATLDLKKELMFYDSAEEHSIERLEGLIARGKGPPPKGKGKRAAQASAKASKKK